MVEKGKMSDPYHRWYLRRVGAFQHQRTILHLDDNEVSINRSRNATHTFQTRFISRKHAILKNVNGEWFLKDNGGVNGTFLNTDRLVPNNEYPLVENDIIGFGMPLSQQNEEDSVVYRLCKDPVTRPSLASSGSSNTVSQESEEANVMVVPNNHHAIKNSIRALQLKKEMQNADETIVKPDYEYASEEPESSKLVSGLPILVIKTEIDSPSENLPECQLAPPEITNCDFTNQQNDKIKVVPAKVKLQNDVEIICIDLEDSEDESSIPIKQVIEPPPTNSSCAPPCEKSSEAACGSASVEDDIISLSDDDHEVDDNLFKANDMTKYCDNQSHMKYVKANDNTHTDVFDRQQVPDSNLEDALKLASFGICHAVSDSGSKIGVVQQVRECASPLLFSERAILNVTNKSSKTNETRLTNEDMAPSVKPTIRDLPVASDETAKSPSEHPSDSDSELFVDISYSQEDELIVISDDESYVSQKNCKAESNAASCIVKQEDVEENALCDLGENDDWDNMFHEKLMKDIASDCAAEVIKSTVETQKTNGDFDTSKVSDPSGIPMQIDEHFNLSEQSLVSKKADTSEALSLPGPSGVITTAEDPKGTDDFFPELSQNFYAGEKSSDSEEDEMQTGHSSVDKRHVEPYKARRSILTSPKKPTSVGPFYNLGSKDNFDRLKHKPGDTPSRGVQPTRALPNFRGRNAAPLQRPPLKPTTYKQKSNSKGRGSTAMKEGLLKNFINDRVRMPGGGTDIPTGRRSPTKEKPGFHVIADKVKATKSPNNTVKSGSSELKKPLNQDVGCGTQRASLSNAPKGRNISNASSLSPQKGVTQDRRSTTICCREQKSRNEQLAAAFLESTSQPSKRKGSPLQTVKPPPKRQATEKPVAELRKEKKDKDLPKPPKKAILLPGPIPISIKHQPSVKPIRHALPLNASSASNSSELDLKNKKSNKKVFFSENPPEIRYYQPDAHSVEEQIQYQDENAFGAGPQRPEVIAALQRILRSILSWRSAWLHEQEKVKHPPPVVNSKDIKDAMTKYSSHAEYVKIYEPLLLLETWESISQEWRQRHDSSPVMQLILIKIRQDSGVSTPQSLYFHCYAVIADVDEQKGHYPQEGWITILDVPVSSENPGAKVDGVGLSYVRLFAYVESFRKSNIHYLKKDEPISALLKQSLSKHKDKKVVLKLILQTRYTVLSVSEGRPLNLEMVAYLKPQLRIFQALHFLPFSLLGSHILKPEKGLCSLLSARSEKTLVNVGTISYNETQRNVILKTTETVSSTNTSPKVCLIQGPPGTGKSSLIIGLILQLLFSDHVKSKAKPRILLCAPSNGAIDEILHRLLELRKALTSSRKLRMIRVGFLESIQPRVRAYSLDNIVRSNIGNQKTMIEKEINDLTTALNVLQQKLDTKKLRNGKLSEVNKLKMDFDRIESKLNVFRKKLDEWNHQSPEDYQHIYRNWREECLKNADVIATTLGSCTQHGMEIFLRNNNHPFICIIDEATQSIEQETLLPLQFCVSKLILIGDPKQLPATVVSRKAKANKLSQSLFERFYHYFENSPPNPIVMLDIQYRMHPELCFYPSKAFYKNKLRTDGEVEQKCSVFPVVPYVFFDVRDSQEESTGKGDISNPREATFVVKLCEALLLKLAKFQSFSLGVITFYQYQKHLIKEKLSASSTLQQLDKVENIEVNTVDGFQGREKDLIIVSSVRANSSNGSIGFISQQRRLNVAITRAKCSLFICGHRESLMVSEHWKGLIDDASFRRKVEKVASPISVTTLQDLVTSSYH